MRKIFFAVMFVLAVTFANTCVAQDVWVERWGDTNVYVMDDTIITDSINETGRYFQVSVKQVKNGQLQKVATLSYIKAHSSSDSEWRYRTSTMVDHTAAVHAVDKVFEFCMNKIGWSYRIGGNDPIVKFYY